MIYVLYGSIELLIKEQINKIKQDNNIDDISVSKYDLSFDLLNNIIEDAESISLFNEKKIIIIENSDFLTSKKIEQTIDSLERYLTNINEQTILIFTVFEKLDERKKIVKSIRKIGHVMEFDTINVKEQVKKFFGEYKITDKQIEMLINRVGEDLLFLSSEIEKIKLYKENDFIITDNDIISLTTKSLEENNFKLIEAIVKKNKKLALELYEERLKLNEEPIAIIVTLANQIRLMYQVKELYKKGYSEKDTAVFLGVHPYRVKLANISAKSIASDTLLKHLYNLSLLDINIKSGKIDKVFSLEMFILKM